MNLTTSISVPPAESILVAKMATAFAKRTIVPAPAMSKYSPNGSH